MSTTNYVIRSSSGGLSRGAVENTGAIAIQSGDKVSLNLRPQQISSYVHNGTSLEIHLTDGSVITLDNFFAAGEQAELFLSSDGALAAVSLSGDQGVMSASYSPAEIVGKFSQVDDLIFYGSEVLPPVAAAGSVPWGLIAAGAGLLGVAALASSSSSSDAAPSLDVAIDPTGGADGVLNAAEVADGVVFTGTTEAGANVAVSFEGQTLNTVADSDGIWTVTFDNSLLTGTEYTGVVTAVATNAAGLTADAARDVPLDIVAEVALDLPVEGDNVIDFFESQDGVTLTGTSDPGTTSVDVTFAGTTVAATVAADGTWSADFAADDIPTSESQMDVTVQSVDGYGNTGSATESVTLNTTVPPINVAIDPTGGADGVLNAAEVADGVVFTGSTEAGANVAVSFEGQTLNTVADSDGVWTVTFPESALSGTEYTTGVSAVATNALGQTGEAARDVMLDIVAEVALDLPIEGDNVIDFFESQDGVTLTGTSDPGTTSVDVTFAGTTVAATVAEDGTWSAEFAADNIPTADSQMDVTMQSVDAYGNTASSTGTVTLHTTVPPLAVTIDPTGGSDGVLNAAEVDGGVVFTGATEAGASVAVSFEGQTLNTVADADGIWTVTFDNSVLTGTEYTTGVSAVATNAIGQTGEAARDVPLDIVAEVALDLPVEGDNVINMDERTENGVSLTGTSDPGTASVDVTFAGTTVAATVAADGTWSAEFAADDIPTSESVVNATGEFTVDVTMNSVDAYGNPASKTENLIVDTEVRNLAIDDGVPEDVNEDGVINFEEALNGITITGTTEIGSTSAIVTLKRADNGVETDYAATVNPDGTWSVLVPAADVSGETNVTISVEATDANGNIKVTDNSESGQSLSFDTIALPTPRAENITIDEMGNTLSVNVDLLTNPVTVQSVAADGSLTDQGISTADVPALDLSLLTFDNLIPDGSDVYIGTEDAAGNQSGLYVAFDDTVDSNVEIQGDALSNLEIDAIDLSFATGAVLTLTESDLLELSKTTDEVIISGNQAGGVADDTLVITGAVNTGETQTIDGESYTVYTLGSAGGTLIVDDEINVVI